MTNTKELTRDIIAVIITIAAIVGAFVTTNEAGTRVIQTFIGLVVGYYFGANTIPVMAAIKKLKESKKDK